MLGALFFTSLPFLVHCSKKKKKKRKKNCSSENCFSSEISLTKETLFKILSRVVTKKWNTAGRKYTF